MPESTLLPTLNPLTTLKLIKVLHEELLKNPPITTCFKKNLQLLLRQFSFRMTHFNYFYKAYNSNPKLNFGIFFEEFPSKH